MAAKKKVISSKVIRNYAKVCASHNRLEKLRYKIRAELLALLAEGWTPATSGPFILVKTGQRRIDSKKWSWKMLATELAIKLFTATGEEDPIAKAFFYILEQELDAPRKEVPVLSAKPNPSLLSELLRDQ